MSSPPRIPARPATSILQMRLIDFDGQPFADKEVHLIWGRRFRLKTDSHGQLVPFSGSGPVRVAVGSGHGTLVVKAGKVPAPPGAADLCRIAVILTSFDSPAADAGRIARLNNLGLYAAKDASDLSAPTASSLGDLGLFATLNRMAPPSPGAPPPQALLDRLADAHDTATGPLVKP